IIAKESLAAGIQKIVAVGGDGTVNEVASALIDTDAVMGILPKGSGNGLSRHLRIPMSIPRAIQLINRRRVTPIDYGLINGIPFFCTAGVGFDAHIGHHFSMLSSRGLTSYVKTTIKEFLSYKPQPYTLKIQDQTIEREAFLITAANASQWGNNAYIAPGASVQDGLLDIMVVSPFPKFLSPAYGLILFSRMIDKSHFVELFRVNELIIERELPGYVHYDGEPISMGNSLSITLKPGGLNIFVPLFYYKRYSVSIMVVAGLVTEWKSAPTITLILFGTRLKVKGDTPSVSPSTSRPMGMSDEMTTIFPMWPDILG
ncbi:MAG: diacylglycerol kinase family protein, partial [Rectinemataceae bacterium]|nr:diacylglycerol kinase family protein [Rectinemataceae bacterium]